MNKHALTLSRKGKTLGIRTETGLKLVKGEFAIDHDHGKAATHRLHVNRLSPTAVELWQTLANKGPDPIGITGIHLFDGRIEAPGSGWQVMHQELFKRDRLFGGHDHYTGKLLEQLDRVEGEFGLAEDFPFPALVFTHPEKGTLLMGVLSQNACKPVWKLAQGRGHTSLQAVEHFFGIPQIELDAGKCFDSEHWVILYNPRGVEEALDDYFQLLKKRIRFKGRTSPLREAIVWGSWNYNIRTRGKGDVDHDYVAANARAMKKWVPDRPRYVMIDDGYQPGRSKDIGGTGCWFASTFEYFYDESKPAWDPLLFPNGMAGVAKAIRRAGCKPALWITPRIRDDSPLAREHPEWLLQLAKGHRFEHPTHFLDYSVPEVRDYVLRVWDTVFKQWGFVAIKMDFWSFPFEVPQVRYRNRGMTAIELRHRFLADLRSFIPADGYVITGCVTNNGNPFVGAYIDSARSARDIGNGSWDNLREAATWLTGISPFYRHDCMLGDADSLGWCADNTPAENRLWATVALMNEAVCEIGGDLTRMTKEGAELMTKAIHFFRKAAHTQTFVFDPCRRVFPADHLLLQRDDGIYEALFNWALTGREVFFPKPVRDLWTGKVHQGRVLIPPHDVIWFKRPRATKK